MQVTYKPEDRPNETQVWEFDPTRVRQSRAEMIEKRYGQRFAVWVQEIQAGEARARRVLLWHLMNLDHAQLKLEDVPDFMMGEVEVDYAISDLQKLRLQVSESAMDDATKEQTLERLDLEIATRLGVTLDEVTPEDLGKEHRSESAENVS
jgi:hypothetical protein